MRCDLSLTASNWHGMGARIKVFAGHLVQIDEVHSGGGYQSHNGLRLHVGLGQHTRVARIGVQWMGGRTHTDETLKADQARRLVEG